MRDKILVTGGAGFIGSQLVARLIRDNHRVVVLDNLSTGRLENLATLKDHHLLSFHKVDVSEFDLIKDYFDGVRWVFHLAGRIDIAPSIERPLDYHQSNVSGTVSVLEASRRCGIEPFMYAGSCVFYGIPKVIPTPETAPVELLNPYAMTKYIGEQYVLHWSRVYKLRAVSLRLFNVIGSRPRTSGTYGAVLDIFLSQRLAGHPLTVVGDGTQTRDFVHVDDVVEAFVRAAEVDSPDKTFNVGSGRSHDINYLAKLIGGERLLVPQRPLDPQRMCADISRIKKTLNWTPRVSLEDAITRMLNNLQAWQVVPVWTPSSISAATSQWFTCLGQEQSAD